MKGSVTWRFHLLCLSDVCCYSLIAVFCMFLDRSLLVSCQSELSKYWREDRYIQCIFCMDYDDRQRLSIYGCVLPAPPSCYGNVCYMRQHKSEYYYLYTSGCLNLTAEEFSLIENRVGSRKADRGSSGIESQLCEVTPQINACVCTNRNTCNNVSSGEPFTEYTFNFLSGITFDEMSHFKYFAPNDPILEQLKDYRSSRKILINSAAPQISKGHPLIILTLFISLICSRF